MRPSRDTQELETRLLVDELREDEAANARHESVVCQRGQSAVSGRSDEPVALQPRACRRVVCLWGRPGRWSWEASCCLLVDASERARASADKLGSATGFAAPVSRLGRSLTRGHLRESRHGAAVSKRGYREPGVDGERARGPSHVPRIARLTWWRPQRPLHLCAATADRESAL